MLKVESLTKSFGPKKVLKDVSLSITPGEVKGFLGINGSGKTTTMRVIMGVLEADSGAVIYDGKPVSLKDRVRFGYMPEERGLYQKMKVREQVEYFAKLYGSSPRQARTRTNELMERLQISQHANSAVQALSLGNQQRAQLAVALVHEPVLLILDEPFSGLDPSATSAVAEVLRERADKGVGVLFSSHQLDLLERLVDSVSILHEGIVVLSGSEAKLRQDASGGLVDVVSASPVVDFTKVVPPGVRVVSVSSPCDVRLDCGEVELSDVVGCLSSQVGVVSFSPVRVSLREIFQEVVK